ncbi:Nucleolar RNA helicase 2 [Porites harrisoni]
MSNTARKGSIALLMAMKGLKQRSSARQQIRTMYYLTKRLPSLVNYQLPRALSLLSPAAQEDDLDVKESGDFSKFRLSEETIERLRENKINYLFPIQSETFDYIYDGQDIIGQARTGTGKTLSFALPLVEKLRLGNLSNKPRRPPKVLVLAPTRELAKQVGDQFDLLKSGLSVHCVYGGVAYGPQAQAIRNGLDVIVGTPGRILDLMVNGTLDLTQLKHVVIDEVDRMLDMGFAQSVEDIIEESYRNGSKENKPQTLLFSATLPPWVLRTAKKYMSEDRKIVDLIGDQELKASETIEHLAIKCPYEARASTISDIVQVYCGAHSRTLIFTETKNDANNLALNSILKQDVQVLHGDIPQEQREITLKSFRDGKVRCLVATDVAARGLDIPEVDLVVQSEPPKDLDTYIHRSGRTGRAGRSGISIVFYKPNQEAQLRAVGKRAGISFKYIPPPQPADIVKASASDAQRFVEAVSPEVLEMFREAAQALVEKMGAVDAVAASLAHISGTKEIKSRSLLNGREGFTTYMMSTSYEIRGPGYMWRVLENNIPDVKEEIEQMKMCSDRKSVVLDVPSHHEKAFEDCWTEGKAGRNITVERISELPELYERPRFGQMGASQHFGERYSQGRDVYQRYGPGQFASKGYGGKESFRRDFRPNRFPEGKNKDHVMNQHRKNISQKFDDWLD